MELQAILTASSGLIASILGFIVKRMLGKLDEMEHKISSLEEKLNDHLIEYARTDSTIESLKPQLNRIEDRLNKLMDHKQ